MSRGHQFPFSAVVGQDDAKLALTLVAADPRIGGVLLRGAKGSAKTTLARGLAALLGDGAPFVELPLGATEDRVVGSLDLAAALTGGEVRFQPGLLAAAHGGVLYVDEVNLLADHLVDVLLDVAASGTNRVEREGVSHSHPSRFVLVGSMNPEEGELRPQLLDRFGLAVDVAASFDADQRAEAVARRLAFDADPAAVAVEWTTADDDVRRRLSGAHEAVVDAGLRRAVSALCADVGAESLRADLVICRSAAALAGLEGRDRATVDDVRQVAPLALAHRRRRQPLDDHGIDSDELDQALDRTTEQANEQTPESPPDHGSNDDAPADSAASDQPSAEDETPESTPAPAAPDAPSRVVPLGGGRVPTGPTGRRATVEGPRGRLVGDRVPDGVPASVAVGATVRAAAARRAGDTDTGTGTSTGVSAGVLVEPGDLREAVRERRAGTLVVLAVDASGSMGAQRRMEAAKGAAVSLLLDAYQRRDRVALVTFRGDDAQVALRPTSSVEVARARLGELPTGGRTPLAAGIGAALDLALAAARGGEGNGDGGHQPLVVLVSDGRATSAPDGADPVQAAQEAAAAVRRRGVPAVVVDAEGSDGPRLGLAADLAAAMGARYLTLAELSAGALTDVVRTPRA